MKFHFGLRQSSSFNFATSIQRHAIDTDNECRNHIIRHIFWEELFKFLLVDLRRWFIICNEKLIPILIILCQHHSFIDTFVLENVLFNLSQLYPESADFHLKVYTSKIVDIAIRQPGSRIAGSVHSLSFDKRIGNKFLLCQVRPVKISSCKTFAGNA